MTDQPTATVRSGDACQACPDGWYDVSRSVDRGDVQRRYLRCKTCGMTAREDLPASAIRRRRK